jgi:hypothetical protein
MNYSKWNEYQLCKQMGWTPSQLRNEYAEDVELYLAFMNEERKAEKANKR